MPKTRDWTAVRHSLREHLDQWVTGDWQNYGYCYLPSDIAERMTEAALSVVHAVDTVEQENVEEQRFEAV